MRLLSASSLSITTLLPALRFLFNAVSVTRFGVTGSKENDTTLE